MQNEVSAGVAKAAIDAITQITRSAIGAIYELAEQSGGDDEAKIQQIRQLAAAGGSLIGRAAQDTAGNAGDPSAADLDAAVEQQKAKEATANETNVQADEGKKASDLSDEEADEQIFNRAMDTNLSPNDRVRAAMGGATAQPAAPASELSPNQTVAQSLGSAAPAAVPGDGADDAGEATGQ